MRPRCRWLLLYTATFQLTHLLRGATIMNPLKWWATKFQLTHLLRGATISGFLTSGTYWISTHAPLARCDASEFRRRTRTKISTHAPLARCDLREILTRIKIIFQLTHLLRGATGPNDYEQEYNISTHAPLARCDAYSFYRRKLCFHFNSRTSCEVRHGTMYLGR